MQNKKTQLRDFGSDFFFVLKKCILTLVKNFRHAHYKYTSKAHVTFNIFFKNKAANYYNALLATSLQTSTKNLDMLF